MSGYRIAIDRTSRTLISRAQGFRNLVIAFGVTGLGSVGSMVGLRDLGPALALLLLGPLFGAFLWRDGVILGRWRAQLGEAWIRCEIDFSALSQALAANPTLPQTTVQGMLETLPTTRDLLDEQAVSVSTREAIIHAVAARDGIESAKLASLIVVLASTTIAGILASLIGAWYPLLALAYLPVALLTFRWARRRRLDAAIQKIQVLRQRADFSGAQYLEMLAKLPWGRSSRDDKARLSAL